MPSTITPRVVAAVLLAGCAAPTPTGNLDPAATLSAVELTPPSASLGTGDSVEFQAIGRMSDGSASAVPLTWSATGGSVTAGGMYHAGGSAGTYLVIAATSDGAHADTAQVTIMPPVVLTGVDVAPGLDTLTPGATRSYSVTGHFSDGSTGAVGVTWSATGGSITGAGVYTAGGTQGTYRVIAQASGAPLADTATVVIRTPTVTLTSVVVAPALDTLIVGASRTFNATGHYSDGSSGNVSVTWSATGGAITQAGLYTAGATVGTYRVIATATAALVADTSQVVIKATPVTLTSVVVTPALDTLAPGTGRSFVATGHYSDGSSGSVAVTWSATGGSITQGGVYTAGSTQGTFRVIGLAAAAGKADTSTVVIKAAAPTLTAVVVNPPSATLDPGGTQAFSVSGQFSDGSTGPVTVTWTATGGTITTGGVYTAGATAGNYRVIATATTAARADTSAVTITQPGASTVLLTEAFEDNNGGARGWYANTSPPISTVEHHSGVGSLEEHWQQGATLPDNGVSLRHLFTATDRLYVRYWVKYSANFVGSGQLYQPHEITLLTDVDDMWIGPSATHLTGYIETNWQNGGIPVLQTTDALNIDVNNINVDLTNVTESRATAGCNGNSDGYTTGCYQLGSEWRNSKEHRASQPVFTNTPGPSYKNDWHKVEVYYQMNTIANGKGQNNGVAQYWIDGALKIDLHNLLIRSGAHPTMKFNQILLAYYIGDGSPIAQTIWVDDLVIATGPVP